ncbi:hypothetical protein ACH5RR_016112 [Cinchona calisaya]|uniref:C2H2-type domain-containing protein n=1 Tax=Cinchona calisaya TaxID=153742 RepID=A0ABD3A0I7_9GENT
MDFEGKHSNSESLSDQENDQVGKFNEGRFYECIFCKRGFTNAQALGGHMNIHRKDKANKTKQKAKQLLVSDKTFEEVKSSRNYERFRTEQPQYYYAVPVAGQMMNYQYFFSAGSSNPNLSQGYDRNDFVAPRQDHLIGFFDDQDGPNLRMEIDRSHDHEDGESGKNTWDENEVDLELRLG